MKENKPIRLSVSQAATLFGVTPKTIRQAIHSQELRYVVVRGRYKLSFESVLRWSQQSSRRAGQLGNQGIGQYVDKWRLTARKYSPNPLPLLKQADQEGDADDLN